MENGAVGGNAVQAGDGAVQQIQRTVAAGKFGGFLFDPCFKVLVKFGEIFCHQVKSSSQLPDFVFTHQLSTYREITLADLVG